MTNVSFMLKKSKHHSTIKYLIADLCAQRMLIQRGADFTRIPLDLPGNSPDNLPDEASKLDV